MLLKDRNGVAGKLQIVLTKGTGEVITHDVENLVVDTGLNYIVHRMKDATVTPMDHVGVGEGTTTPVGADTVLEQEIGRAAVSSVVVTANKLVYSVTFVPGIATGAITEAGIFNDAVSGVMLSRTVFPVINKQIADTMSITWTVTLNDATP